MRRRKREEQSNTERWLVSYADFITLLFAFFVVMYSISSVNEGKYRVLADTLTNAFDAPVQSPNPVVVGEAVRTLIPQPGEFADLAPVEVTPVERLPDQNDTAALYRIQANLNLALEPFIDQELVKVTRTERGIEVEMQSEMLFKSGSASLSRSAFKALQDIAAIVRSVPNKINVEGHTDNVPIKTISFPSNWELSAARAASVVHVLAKLGVESPRMAATGYGEYQPIQENDSEEGRQANRRVALVIMAGDYEREVGRIGRASGAPR
ncbi:MAG: flagellar motor protein MotD [Chromatiaceae bacterium]|nr:flagellar motor protein MotD [Chromatiaceae bacterium]